MTRRLVSFLATCLATHRLLLLILGVGFGLRLGWLWFQGNASFVLDEQEYVEIAQALRRGGYLGEVDDGRWIRPPLFPLWLAFTFGPGNHLLLARSGQVVLGVVLIYLFYRLTLLAWGDVRSALVCAALAALSLPLIVFSTYLMAEMLLLVLLCGLLLVLLALARGSGYRLATLAGVLLGLALLTKPIALAAIPATLGAVLAGQPHWHQRVRHLVVLLVGAAVVLAPWAVRNRLVYDRFIPLDTTGGYNLWIGNRPPGQGGAIFEETMRTAYPNPADRSARLRRLPGTTRSAFRAKR
ncbi:MAG: phospholipid carrier-dependent glycosyltransferase [Chloroflexaceae bacterium]|nr:phospholipid carrier-dependent glycosyltransferase [Chloroflexaceae bacterium]